MREKMQKLCGLAANISPPLPHGHLLAHARTRGSRAPRCCQFVVHLAEGDEGLRRYRGSTQAVVSRRA